MKVIGMPEYQFGTQVPTYDTLNVGGVSIGGGYTAQATSPLSIFGDTIQKPQIQDINILNGVTQKQPIDIMNAVMELIIAYMPYLNLVDDKVQRALRHFADRYAAGKLNVTGVPSDLTDIVAHIINSTSRILVSDDNTAPLFDNFIERLGEYSKSVPVISTRKSKYYDAKANDLTSNLAGADNLVLSEFIKFVQKNNIVISNYNKFNKYLKEMVSKSKNTHLADAFNKIDTTKLFNHFIKVRG